MGAGGITNYVEGAKQSPIRVLSLDVFGDLCKPSVVGRFATPYLGLEEESALWEVDKDIGSARSYGDFSIRPIAKGCLKKTPEVLLLGRAIFSEVTVKLTLDQ